MKDNTKFKIAIITAFSVEVLTAIFQITGILPEYKINWLEFICGIVMITSICLSCYYYGKARRNNNENKN